MHEGFLRRCLDKFHHLRPYVRGDSEEYMHWKVAKFEGKPLPPPSRYRADAIAFIQLIKVLANFHNIRHGSANDLIFHKNYSVVEICCEIITASAHCPRNETLFLLAMETLSVLSKDIMRFYSNYCEKLNILQIILQELSHMEGYSSAEHLSWMVSIFILPTSV